MQQENSIHLEITSSASSEVGELYSNGETEFQLVCKLRDLPSRRTVWEALCGETTVLLKIYHRHPKQARDADSEWENANRLVAAGLKVAAPLFRSQGKAGEVVLGFEYIPNGETLDQHLKSEGDFSHVLEQLFSLHAEQHNAGCYQSDNHLGNYLCSGMQLYMLDAGSFVFSSEALSFQQRLESLAMLMANIPLPLKDQVKKALSSYLEQCPSEIDSSQLEADLWPATHSAIQTRLKKYFKKTRRSCTEFEREDGGGRTWLACRGLAPSLKQRLQHDPDQFFDNKDLLKDGNTCTVIEIVSDGVSYVLKRYNKKPLGYRLTHAVSSPRALRSWTNGHVLNLFGIRTPRPLACLLVKPCGLIERGYLLMEKVEGETLDAIDTEEILAPGSRIPEAFARRWQELEALFATHGDMKASNFIVSSQGHLTLIDLDGLKFDRSDSSHQRRREKDMKRFMRNWEETPDLARVFQEALADSK